MMRNRVCQPVEPREGIDVLVDAFAKLDDREARLFVVGDGVERAALTARAKAPGAGARITFAGTRPHGEIPRWLAAADVCALPSRAEGMPNAVLEALASGRPVVATAVGGTPELIASPSLGRLVPPDDAQALSCALAEALSSPWDAAAIAASVAPRTWDEVARRKARALELAAGNSPSSLHTPAPESKSWHAGTR
jgi:glycosyltransferase involved in cell wall biosynthesis